MERLICLIICLLSVSMRADYPQSVSGLFKDNARLDMLYHPDRVEICMWYPKPSSNKVEPGCSLEAYNAGKYVLLPSDVATLITWKLTTDANYTWNESVDGERVLHARVRYSKGGHVLTADFNFSCSIAVFSYDEEIFSSGLFYPGADWVFQIAERMFPKDKVVQAIKKQKESLISIRLDCEIAKAVEVTKSREANAAAQRP